MVKKYILISYDTETASYGDPLDMYSYLFNEMDNDKIICGMREYNSLDALVVDVPNLKKIGA